MFAAPAGKRKDVEGSKLDPSVDQAGGRMDPQGPPKEIPINIDPNAWQIVLRDGVPTLVPRQQPEPAALIRFNNGNPTAAGNLLLTQGAYEQGLALDYASQKTPLSEQQHQFLSNRLQALRGTIEQLENNIDQRRALTVTQAAHLAGFQTAPSSSSNAAASTSQAPPSVTHPNQQNQNVSQRGDSVYYNNVAQSVGSGVNRQLEPSHSSNRHNNRQATTNANQQSTKYYFGQSATAPSAGDLPTAAASTANGPIASHHRQLPSQEQRRQMFQQYQQTYINSSQPLNTAASQVPYATNQSQAATSRAGPNVHIPQPNLSKFHHQSSQGTSSQAQGGVPYSNGNGGDYRTRGLNSGPVNNNQTPYRQPNAFPQAHISPMSHQSSSYRHIQPNITNVAPETRSNVARPQPQQSVVPNRPTIVDIPPAQQEWTQHSSGRPYAPQPGLPNPLSMPPTSSRSVFAPPGPPGSYQPVRRQSQSVGVPERGLVTTSASVPVPRLVQPSSASAPSLPPPLLPVEPLVLPTQTQVKKEPEEELSLAESVLLLYGKRKTMDSVGSPGPASKRRAMGAAAPAERHEMNLDVPSRGALGSQIASSGALDAGYLNEFQPVEGAGDVAFNEPVSTVKQVGADLAFEDPTLMADPLPSEDVPMDQMVSEVIQNTTTLLGQTAGPSRGKDVDDPLHLETLSDDMNVPETSRSPSAARISSVSVSDAQDPAHDVTADIPHLGGSEAEVEGEILVDGHSNDYQMTPVPERKSPSLPPLLPSAPSEDGTRGHAERQATPMLRSPSIPLFQSAVDTDQRKGKGKSRSRSPSEPLFLPVGSSSSSPDVEMVAEPPREKNKSKISGIHAPGRHFLGVNVPFVPGFSRERPHSHQSGTHRRRGHLRIESSSSSGDEPAIVISGAPPVFNDNGHGIDPYSLLNPTPCLWAGCDARLDSLMKLMKHVEIVHTAPESQSVKHPRCGWDGCRKQRPSFGVSNKLLRHVIKHISPEMSCMVADCPFSSRSREEFQQHYDAAHKNDQSLEFKPSTLPALPPREPSENLPDFAPVSEALYLPIYGDPGATFRSRPPSPHATSQAVSTMPLSPTKHTPRRKDTYEKRIDEYSFLDPFYPPSLHMDDLVQNAAELFEIECQGPSEVGHMDYKEREMSEEI